ncbi:MAG: hypothetical protein LC658_07690, partial [Bacteroidales bacterium]|nr:hypothetical protein [Bacteroidales bacterium]
HNIKIFLLIICASFYLQTNADINEKESTFVIGAHWVNRHMKEYNYNYSYPRLSLEYRVTNNSSVEYLSEYINHKYSGNQVISYPISLGYKLNILPVIIKNERITDKLKINQSIRYTLLLSPEKANSSFSDLRIFHYLRYAPGIDYYLYNNWGVNYELVFGRHLRTTMAFGIKYRF